LALEALGALAGLEDAPDFVDVARYPDTGKHARYRLAIERQQALYEKLVKAKKKALNALKCLKCPEGLRLLFPPYE
jgi:hypothetical protein